METRRRSVSNSGSKANTAISESFAEKRVKGEKLFQTLLDLPDITSQYDHFFRKAVKIYIKVNVQQT